MAPQDPSAVPDVVATPRLIGALDEVFRYEGWTRPRSDDTVRTGNQFSGQYGGFNVWDVI